MVRQTKQKEAIEAVIKREHHPLKLEEIHQLALQQVPSLGIATVYRSIKYLVEEGRVTMVQLPGEVPRYEEAHKGHHHHFFCRSCQGVFELENCVQGVQQLAPPGFQVTDHEITLYGSCPHCAS